MKILLRRYTNLPATLHILRNRCLTLLSPAAWDDRNDAHYMAEYQQRTGAASVLALCFTEADETYHHWRVFSSGSDGICISFAKDRLEAALKDDACIKMRRMRYLEINAAASKGLATREIPFVKRLPYQDECEYRILYTSPDPTGPARDVAVPLAAIDRISLSPWMPVPLADAVKQTIKAIPGCRDMKVYRSTLVDNGRWKKLATPALRA